MGQFQSNLNCIYRLAQSGKTQLVSDIINDCKNCVDTFGEEDTLHFFITSNNQVLVGQTGTRFDDSYNWVSANKGKEYYKLLLEILHNQYSMVVMCSNRARMNHLRDLINELEKSPLFNKSITIWIDEADASIKLWSSYEDIISKDIVAQVTLVSATFEPVFKKYKRLQVIGYKDPHPKQYRCLRDSVKIVNDYAGTILEYIDHIFTKYPHLVVPGIRGFLPGTFYKASHDSIAELLSTKYKFAVLIINGSRKEIVLPGKGTISLEEHLQYNSNGDIPDEFKEILARIYVENKLYEYPFAITGLECVKRGITFQSEGFLFDFGIIPAIVKKTESYQLIARLFGNIGGFKDYKPCEIYSTSSNFKKIEGQEAIAMNLSTMVFENGLKDVGKEEIQEAININDTDWELLQREFRTREDANTFLYSLGCNKNHKETKKGDFILSSTTKGLSVLCYPDVIKEFRSYKKTSTFDIKKSKIGTTHSRMFICYKDTTDPSSIVFIVRIIKKIK